MMTAYKVEHASFTIERIFPACRAHVFSAWSSVEAKAKWFAGPPGWTLLERKLDFRPGGAERLVGRWPDGVVTEYDARIHDITDGARIIYAYDMHVDGKKISVSLSTIDIADERGGTHMTYTEQMAILDPMGNAESRTRGTNVLFDNLEAALTGASAH